MYKATRMAFVDLFVEPLNERGSSPFTNLSCMVSAASPKVKHLTGNHAQAPVLQRLYELCCQCRCQKSNDCYQNHLLTYSCGNPARDLFLIKIPSQVALLNGTFCKKSIVDQRTQHAECASVPDLVLCFCHTECTTQIAFCGLPVTLSY